MARATGTGLAGRAMMAAAIAGAVAAVLGAVTGATAATFVGAWVGFGLLPGLALGRLLAPGDRVPVALARALFLSPLLSGAAAVVLLLAGMDAAAAAPAILIAGYVAGLPAAVRFRAAGSASTRPALSRDERRLLGWMLALAVLALVPHLREWIRMRSDAWFHAAVVHEIDARGVPPEDPYFAGLRLQYMWVYHALLAVWSRAAGVAAWDLAGALNAVWLTSLGGGVYALSRRVGRPGGEALFAAVFVPLGLHALFTLWIPLKLARALVGETRGWAELGPAFSLAPFGIDRVFHFMFTLGSPPPLLNKYLVMTALGGAITGLVWLAEGLVAWVRRPGSGRAVQVALVMFATWIWHPALGLAGALGCGLAGLWLLARPGSDPRTGIPRPRILGAATLVAAGSAAAAPLLLATAGDSAAPFPIGLYPRAILPILVSSLAALLFGIPALRRLRPTPARRAFCALAAGLMIASFLVVLPEPNSQDKMPFVFYLLPATAAGWMLARIFRALRMRGRRVLAWAGLLAMLGPASALTWAGYLFDPADPPLASGERELYAWLRAETPADAVVLDSDDRADVLVRVPRRQYWGRENYARTWGYDTGEMDRRRLARDVLLGRPGPGEQGDLCRAAVDSTVRAEAIAILTDFARRQKTPVYILWRPEDHGGLTRAAGVLGDREQFAPVWSNPAATVFRLAPPGEHP